jgi:preprotein translocase subunit SecD
VDPLPYSVTVQFTGAGTETMRVASKGHFGRHMAILIDGQVVAAALIRSAISDSAMVTENFTKAQAERVANGIGS